MKPAYTAVERFDATDGLAWTRYIKWSGLFHLVEVVTLDASLCPCVVGALAETDWKHVLAMKPSILLDDLALLLRRVQDEKHIQILKVFRNPGTDPTNILFEPHFEFIGYDLIEKGGSISALTNFDGTRAILPIDELTNQGTISCFSKALNIKALLANQYPDEPHADCDIWAIWRMA